MCKVNSIFYTCLYEQQKICTLEIKRLSKGNVSIVISEPVYRVDEKKIKVFGLNSNLDARLFASKMMNIDTFNKWN